MREKLEILLKENPNTIMAEVIEEALAEEDPKYFFEHLLQYGCQSWFVWSMIRYSDTHKFYDKYYDEIEDIRFELQETGILENLNLDQDLKNYFAWLAFEHVAYNIYNQIEE